MLQRPLRLLILTALPAALLLAAHAPLRAYEPPMDEMVKRILSKSTSTSRAIIRTRSRVFDPSQGNGASSDQAGDAALRIPGVGPDETLPVEQPEREFHQTTYWIRNSFLAVETFAADGELLHFYINEAMQPLSVNFSEERKFSELDILLPYLPFMEESRADWQEGLDRWGLQPASVDFVRAAKGKVYYRLLESPGKFLWVDRIRHLPVRLHTLLEGGRRPLALTIEFGEFLLIQESEGQTFAFPRTINYLLNGRLFKQTVVQKFDADPPWRRFPLTRLRKKGRELRESESEAGDPGGVQ